MNCYHNLMHLINRPVFTACLLATTALLLAGCQHSRSGVAGNNHQPTGERAIGMLESNDPRFGQLIAPDARIEKLAENFAWAEGPIWIKNGGYLLFSDVPSNTVFKWKSGRVSEFLKPSGYTGKVPRGGATWSHGLTLDFQNPPTLCV